MLKSDTLTKINRELSLGESARQKGNEGMARVCARRAAGLAAQESLAQWGVDVHKINGLDALRIFSQGSDFPAAIRHSAVLLTMRVTPEHQFPIEVDLLQEARNFIQELDRWMEDQID
jgi:hypothetical protein